MRRGVHRVVRANMRSMRCGPASVVMARIGLRAGSTVGPYRLIRELGRGGMGFVWLAERIDGTLKRQIALKLPKQQLGERFVRERDILAGLVHSNIARLYDAGATTGLGSGPSPLRRPR